MLNTKDGQNIDTSKIKNPVLARCLKKREAQQKQDFAFNTHEEHAEYDQGSTHNDQYEDNGYKESGD